MKCPKCHFDNPEDSRYCRKCGTRIDTPVEFYESPTMTLSESFQPLAPGSVFANRYQIIEDLGAGGMGRVYKVFDTEIKERIALKLILPEIAAEKKTIQRFQNELKFARKISHKNVCRMYHLSKEKDSYYITMEYVPGESLKNMLRMTRQLSLSTIIHLAKEVCEGLAEAHRLGVIHRDLKPQNIMVDKDGNVRIMDFGIARSLKTEKGTGAGVILGTPEYMSPEQIEGKEIDGRSDIYSLGVVLYEMAVGKVPFESDSVLNVLVKHKTESPEPPQKTNPELPDSLGRIIMKCLQKKKENRYQTAQELFSDLVRIESGLTPRTGAVPRKKSTASRQVTLTFELKKLIFPGLAVAAAVALAIFAWKYIAGKSAPPAVPRANVAVISFANQTGDPSYDYLQEAIPNLLITSLEQSNDIHVATWERLNDLLKRMGKQDTNFIDADLGFELCRMDGTDAIVLGSFVKAGNVFATDVKVLDVKTKRLIKSASSRGEGVDSILKKQIDELSNEISEGLILTEPAAYAETSPIVEVTTDSFEAYNLFLKGREAFEKMYPAEARALFEKAVALDPKFSMAYIYLARANANLGNIQAVENAVRIFNQLQRSEESQKQKKKRGKEALYFEVLKAKYIEKNEDKVFQPLKQYAEEYPKEKRAHVELAEYFQSKKMIPEAKAEWEKALEIDPQFGYALNAMAYFYLNQKEFPKALEYFQKYIAAYPNDANPRDSMGDAYFLMGKHNLAIEKYQEALKIKPDFGSDFKIGYCYALTENYLEALRRTDQFISLAPSNGTKALGYLLKGFYYQILGRSEHAFKEWDVAEGLLRSVQDNYSINIVKRSRVWSYYESGKMELFQKYAKERVDHRIKNKISSEALNTAYEKYYAGFYDLGQNRLEAIPPRLAEIESLFPKAADKQEAAFMQECYHHLASEMLLAQGKIDEALEEYKKISRQEISFANVAFILTAASLNLPFRDDFVARAMVAKGEKDKAIAEYERILQPLNTNNHLAHPLARFRLARLYEEKGLRKEASEQYQRVVGIWKDADPAFEEVQIARRRLIALQAH